MPSRDIPRLRAQVERASANVHAAERALSGSEQRYKRLYAACLNERASAIEALRTAQDYLDAHQASLNEALIDLEVYGPAPPANYGRYRPLPGPQQTEAQYFAETWNSHRGVRSVSCSRCGYPVPAYGGTVVRETCGLGGSSTGERG